MALPSSRMIVVVNGSKALFEPPRSAGSRRISSDGLRFPVMPFLTRKEPQEVRVRSGMRRRRLFIFLK